MQTKILVGRSEEKTPLGRPRDKWEDNIKLDFKLEEKCVEWINLAQNKEK
jgi:hypothetical protein